jgi:phosphorylase kinase alpha/beta subunit
MDTDWLEWRTARGLITHFDANFLKDIWHSLMFSQSLVFSNATGGSFHLDCKTIRQSMTPGEESFAHLIDQLNHQLYPAYYKSAVVEALYAYTQFCINNPQMRFQKPLVFREVLERAAVRYMAERATQMNSLGIETDLTVFMQQSPHIMNLYVTLIYAEITQPY